jgi:hypothetical protein
MGNLCMHLTNYAVNKHSDAFHLVNAHDAGSKRSLSSVFNLIEAEGGPTAVTLWAEIRALAEKTILALRPALVEYMAAGDHGAFHPAGPKGFHILGFDILFDERYRPTLIELNANSSLSVLQPSQCTEASETGAKAVEVSELDLTIKAELITQALLVANPLRHRLALQGRIAWFEATHGSRRLPLGANAPVDEPIPLDDDGHPVHETAMVALPRPDRPDKCPALRTLEFWNHTAYLYVQNQLQAYRIWRHYSFSPPGSCALRDDQPNRRYLGFGRLQFRQLCDAAGLIAFSSARYTERGPSIVNPVWNDRRDADIFWSQCGAAETQASFDFPRFLRCIVIPIGEALASNIGDAGDALEAFIAHVLASASQQPRCGAYADEQECEDSFHE